LKNRKRLYKKKFKRLNLFLDNDKIVGINITNLLEEDNPTSALLSVKCVQNIHRSLRE